MQHLEMGTNTLNPSYFRRNGLPLALMLSGVAYIFLPYFWLFIGLFLVGTVLFAFDVWKEAIVPKQNIISKIVFAIACLSIFTAFATWLFLPVPLQMSVRSTVPQYGENSNIYGIVWSKDFSQMDFTLKNSGDADYDNFDVEISTDLTFEGLKQTGGISTCAIAPAGSVIHFTNQKMVGGTPVGPRTMVGGVPVGPAETNPNEYEIVGIGPNGELTFSGNTAKKYRIRCDKLPANSEETFIAALSVINLPKKLGEPLGGPPRPALWCTVKAKFTYLGRPRSVLISECKMGQDCKL